jgi:hypothetical protein
MQLTATAFGPGLPVHLVESGICVSWRIPFLGRKATEILHRIEGSRGISYWEALSILSKRLAVIQYWPYHGPSLQFPRSLADELESNRLAVQYVHEVVVPKALRGEALLIAIRKCKEWGVQKLAGKKNVVVFTGSSVRGASLSLINSPGGKAIARHLELPV